jgi:hypothetical protein
MRTRLSHAMFVVLALSSSAIPQNFSKLWRRLGSPPAAAAGTTVPTHS